MLAMATELELELDLNIIHNGVEVTDSRDLAKIIGKQHYTLMRDIRSYIDNMKEDPNTDVYSANSQDLNNNIDEYFIESTYKDANNQIRN